jgi:hypothetical protein
MQNIRFEPPTRCQVVFLQAKIIPNAIFLVKYENRKVQTSPTVILT